MMYIMHHQSVPHKQINLNDLSVAMTQMIQKYQRRPFKKKRKNVRY
jgi:hypothetical protein